MKLLTKWRAMLVAMVLTLAFAVPAMTSAQTPAYDTNFTTSITYQNVGTQAAEVSLVFYAENSATPITSPQPNLNAGAGASVFVGSLSEVDADFRGSAILQSSQPVVATLVQVAQQNPFIRSFPLSNGFDGSEGANSFRIPTVLKNKFRFNSIFSVQNVGSAPVTGTVKFYNSDNGGQLTHTADITALPAGAALYFDAATITQLGASFNGSAIIDTNGPVVASVMELEFAGIDADAYEGVSEGATTVYMASAFCNYFNLQTAYAVQNVGDAATNVTVKYYNTANQLVLTQNANNVAPGAKANFNGCPDFPANTLGSAVITSSGEELVAVGKAYGAGYTTAFVGSTGGADNIALPYVRWTQGSWVPNGKQRAFIAIQNVGTTTVSGATVSYRDKNGAQVATDTLPDIAPGGKTNSDPFNFATPAQAEFGYYADGTFGGGAIITAPDGSQLVAVVRIVGLNQNNIQNGEDYSGIPLQ